MCQSSSNESTLPGTKKLILWTLGWTNLRMVSCLDAFRRTSELLGRCASELRNLRCDRVKPCRGLQSPICSGELCLAGSVGACKRQLKTFQGSQPQRLGVAVKNACHYCQGVGKGGCELREGAQRSSVVCLWFSQGGNVIFGQIRFSWRHAPPPATVRTPPATSESTNRANAEGMGSDRDDGFEAGRSAWR